MSNNYIKDNSVFKTLSNKEPSAAVITLSGTEISDIVAELFANDDSFVGSGFIDQETHNRGYEYKILFKVNGKQTNNQNSTQQLVPIDGKSSKGLDLLDRVSKQIIQGLTVDNQYNVVTRKGKDNGNITVVSVIIYNPDNLFKTLWCCEGNKYNLTIREKYNRGGEVFLSVEKSKNIQQKKSTSSINDIERSLTKK